MQTTEKLGIKGHDSSCWQGRRRTTKLSYSSQPTLQTSKNNSWKLSEPPLLCWWGVKKRHLTGKIFWWSLVVPCWHHPRDPWTAVCTMMAVIVVAMIEGTTSRAVVGGAIHHGGSGELGGIYYWGQIQSLLLDFVVVLDRFFIFTPTWREELAGTEVMFTGFFQLLGAESSKICPTLWLSKRFKLQVSSCWTSFVCALTSWLTMTGWGWIADDNFGDDQ